MDGHATNAIEADSARIERERLLCAQADADIEAGLGIEDEEMAAWLERLDHDPDAPLEVPGGKVRTT